MAKSFEDHKSESKWSNVKKINNDDERLLKIKDVVDTGSLDPEEVKKLLTTVRKHGDSMLNPDYVAQQLIKPGQHVIVYNRNSDLLPEDEQGLPSAFMLYHLQQAKLIKDMLTNCSYNFPSIHFIKFIYVSSIMVCNHFKG